MGCKLLQPERGTASSVCGGPVDESALQESCRVHGGSSRAAGAWDPHGHRLQSSQGQQRPGTLAFPRMPDSVATMKLPCHVGAYCVHAPMP